MEKFFSTRPNYSEDTERRGESGTKRGEIGAMERAIEVDKACKREGRVWSAESFSPPAASSESPILRPSANPPRGSRKLKRIVSSFNSVRDSQAGKLIRGSIRKTALRDNRDKAEGGRSGCIWTSVPTGATPRGMAS